MNSIITKMKDDRFRSILFLVLAALLWSLGGLLIKSIKLNALAIAGVRSFTAALLMLTVIRKPSLKFNRYKIGGAIAYVGTVALFVMANKLTTAATAILLQYTAPIYVALLGAWFLKERTTFMDWVTIFMVFGGMILFFIDDVGAGGMLGNIYAILSGFSFACMVLLLRKQKDASPLESVFWGNVLTAIIGLPFMFGARPDASSWIALLLLGVFQLGLSYMLYALAIKHVTALEAILIPVIEPILNPVWVFLVLGEYPGPWAFVGGFIVLSAIVGRSVLMALKANRKTENNEAV
ncbi:MAG TPA: DMT family transporter [Clostridia bacterium]|nr:DMT family transporter [Clostridia bacterium]